MAIKKSDLSRDLLFENIIKDILIRYNHPNTGYSEIEPLSHFSYDLELEIKNKAIHRFWKDNLLEGKPEGIIPSVKPRFYRTTTKRKIFNDAGKFYLGFSERENIRDKLQTNLDPIEHQKIYQFLVEAVNTSKYTIVGKSANFFIIRGNYSEFAVIFNMHKLDSLIIKKIKLLTEELKLFSTNIISCFIYFDPTRSDYYLESYRPDNKINFKKIYGPDKLFLKFDSYKYSYYPTSFSQINESLIPTFLSTAKALIKPEGTERLVDLYCGYGLFSLYLSNLYSEIIGIDSENSSIQSAIENLKFINTKSRYRFISAKITPETVKLKLAEPTKKETFILDPPRMGTEKGVIRSIAERGPEKIIHIFCGINNIPYELNEWSLYKYKPMSIVPLDMFPGTFGVEIQILLSR